MFELEHAVLDIKKSDQSLTWTPPSTSSSPAAAPPPPPPLPAPVSSSPTFWIYNFVQCVWSKVRSLFENKTFLFF